MHLSHKLKRNQFEKYAFYYSEKKKKLFGQNRVNFTGMGLVLAGFFVRTFHFYFVCTNACVCVALLVAVVVGVEG